MTANKSMTTVCSTLYHRILDEQLLKDSDMKRQSHALVQLALNHRAHDPKRCAQNLWLVLREGELEVLDEISDNGLHLDQSSRACGEHTRLSIT